MNSFPPTISVISKYRKAIPRHTQTLNCLQLVKNSNKLLNYFFFLSYDSVGIASQLCPKSPVRFSLLPKEEAVTEPPASKTLQLETPMGYLTMSKSEISF